MNKDYKEYIIGKKHLSISGLTILITLSTILVFTGGGYYLDSILETNPYLTILGLLLSYPVAQVLIAKFIKKHIIK